MGCTSYSVFKRPCYISYFGCQSFNEIMVEELKVLAIKVIKKFVSSDKQVHLNDLGFRLNHNGRR